MTTAMTGRFSAAIADATAGRRGDGVAVVERLVRRGMLIADTADDERRYRWPDAAREVLTEELADRDPHGMFPLTPGYRGRFAPSPTGRLHFGSLVAALGSWLFARAADGQWLVRIEDLDREREVAGAARDILATLAAFGMSSDAAVLAQNARTAVYAQALRRLEADGHAYRCWCSRADLEHLRGIHPARCIAPPTLPRARRWRRMRCILPPTCSARSPSSSGWRSPPSAITGATRPLRSPSPS